MALGSNPAIEVRPAGPADVDELAGVLGRAFTDDPVFAWMLPDEAYRRRRIARFFALLTGSQHLGRGGVELAVLAGGERIGACAQWDPPGTWQVTGTARPGVVARYLWAFARHPSYLARCERVERTMAAVHPSRPHWYLSAIGTEPALQGTGLGSALVRHRLERCDAVRLPAYLESTKATNLGYYERFGFRVTREIVVPGGPTLWAMWREPA